MSKESDQVSQMQKSAPLVSVVMPCFNAEVHVEKAIFSVLSQSYANIELLCVDDYSTDNTVSILEKMARADERVKVLSASVKGANNARMAGVLAARGAYIAFIDDDDEWPSESLELLVDTAINASADIVCGNILQIRGSEKQKLYRFGSELGKPLDLNGNSRVLLDMPPSACAKLFRRGLFYGLKFLQIPFAQDWNISYKAAARANIVVYIDDIVYRYVRRSVSTSAHRVDLSARGVGAVCESVIDVLKFWKQEKRAQYFQRELDIICSRFVLNMVDRTFSIQESKERRRAVRKLRKIYAQMVPVHRRFAIGVQDKARTIVASGLLSSRSAYMMARRKRLALKHVS